MPQRPLEMNMISKVKLDQREAGKLDGFTVNRQQCCLRVSQKMRGRGRRPVLASFMTMWHRLASFC